MLLANCARKEVFEIGFGGVSNMCVEQVRDEVEPCGTSTRRAEIFEA